MDKKKILDWLSEITDQEPWNFQEYCYDDVRRFIVDEKIDWEKIKSLFNATLGIATEVLYALSIMLIGFTICLIIIYFNK